MALHDIYINLILQNGSRPSSIRNFVSSLREEEAAQFNEKKYTSFNEFESDIFFQSFEDIMYSLKEDATYQTYNPREKLLAVFFTLLARLNAKRKFWQIINQEESFFSCVSFMDKTKPLFEELLEEIIEEGKDLEIVAGRPFEDYYSSGIWLQLKYVFDFWLKDESENQEQTDAAVEKACTFAFDVMEPNLLDSGFDFFKFVFQNK